MKQRQSGPSSFPVLRTLLVLTFVLAGSFEAVAQAVPAVRPAIRPTPHVERLDGLPRTPEQMQQVQEYESLASAIAVDERRDHIDPWTETFGITKNEELVLKTILLDAFDFGQTLDKQMEPDCARYEIPDQAQICQNLIDRRFLRYEAAVYSLWQQLGATEFAKVEHWVGLHSKPHRPLGRPLYDRTSSPSQSPTGTTSSITTVTR